jgi:putative flippase GtrA
MSPAPQPAPDAAPRASALTRARAALVRHFPPGQFARYLVVGLVNTAFGYSTYAALTAALTPHIPYAYVAASVIAGFFAFTFSYFNYKLFIFRTRGNYLREWLRCVAVYSGGLAFTTLLLPPTVAALRHFTRAGSSAPYIAGALLMGINVLASFLGHKNFSFAK